MANKFRTGRQKLDKLRLHACHCEEKSERLHKGLILVVEDNEKLLEANCRLLESAGYETMPALDALKARERMNEAMPDGVILDILLPGGVSGLDFLEELRVYSDVPVLLLTALDTPGDIVKGLTSGGDDYLPKPFNIDVFLARVEALMRRASRMPEILTKGPLRLDIAASQAFLNGEDLLLTQKEFSLLLLFVQNEDKIMSAEYLYRKVWGQATARDKNAVRVAVTRLREKIKTGDYAITMLYGKGYRYRRVKI
jgi:DNA-binding response OmpR family regulator